MSSSSAFISASMEAPALPLQRFLPPVRLGVAANWLAANVPPKSSILDPFGTSPIIALEAARAGHAVILAANNPVVRFITKMTAAPPSLEELHSALASLAALRSGEDRLEPEIQSLYASECPVCKTMSIARAFIWEQEGLAPIGKIIHCQHCGNRDEHPVDQADIDKASTFRREGPHRARALERIAGQDNALRSNAEEALETYLPRAIYAFFTILNRLDRLKVDQRQQQIIDALLLVALDRGNSLWEHPSGRPRPKRLVNPPQFREHNVWKEIEDSLELWNSIDLQAPLVQWPQRPKPGQISLFPGSFRRLDKSLEGEQFQAIISALPRPNQAYWTLSALWAGWLWGRDAIGPFGNVLKRRRYDWSWHAEALHSTLKRSQQYIQGDTKFFAVMGESEERFLSSAISAANLAKLSLSSLALRKDTAESQLTWGKWEQGKPLKDGDSMDISAGAIRAYLQDRGQPSDFFHLQAAALSALAPYASLGLNTHSAGELQTAVQENIENAMKSKVNLIRFGSSSKSLEAGQWWLANEQEHRSPLFDRIEIAFVRHLLRKGGHTFAALDQALCNVFPGLLTPESHYLDVLLRSYGLFENSTWQIKIEDHPKARRADLEEMQSTLLALGNKLFQASNSDRGIEWELPQAQPKIHFFPIASGIFSEFLLGHPSSQQTMKVILIPGSRSELVLTKLKADPRLEQILAQNWHFVKYRHIRRLAQNDALTSESFLELLHLDPISEDPIQPPLL